MGVITTSVCITLLNVPGLCFAQDTKIDPLAPKWPLIKPQDETGVVVQEVPAEVVELIIRADGVWKVKVGEKWLREGATYKGTKIKKILRSKIELTNGKVLYLGEGWPVKAKGNTL